VGKEWALQWGEVEDCICSVFCSFLLFNQCLVPRTKEPESTNPRRIHSFHSYNYNIIVYLLGRMLFLRQEDFVFCLWLSLGEKSLCLWLLNGVPVDQQRLRLKIYSKTIDRILNYFALISLTDESSLHKYAWVVIELCCVSSEY
jgi:hypothetical protein